MDIGFQTGQNISFPIALALYGSRCPSRSGLREQKIEGEYHLVIRRIN